MRDAAKTSIRLDELRIDGLVPFSDAVATANRPEGMEAERKRAARVSLLNPTSSPRLDSRDRSPFQLGRVTRILQHNGEPLEWVRSLGFDAVLLPRPPDAVLLSEAIRARMLVYAPPPSSPDPTLRPLLEPVAGWFLGFGEALDRRHVQKATLDSDHIRGFPEVWQRPILAAPSEAWRDYAPIVDAIIDDLPPRVRGLVAAEEVAQMHHTRHQARDLAANAVGIVSMPPDSLVNQTESIARAIGAPAPEGFRWHSMWLQSMRSLEAIPSAILFRSTRSLSSPDPTSNTRALALSYINRMVAMVEPWVATSTPAPPPAITGAPYRCARLSREGTDVLILTSTATRGNEVLAGDGESIEILLTPNGAAKNAWRMTHFTSERLSPKITETGPRLEIVSPDVVEIVVLSSDPSVGGSLSQSAERFARQASLDRWQLAEELVRRTSQGWLASTATLATNQSTPTNLIAAARQTLSDAEPRYLAGDTNATLRMARRADGWALRSQWQLAEALMPFWPNPVSCPPLDVGASQVHLFWRPLMDEAGWGKNRLSVGSLDEPTMIQGNRWHFGRRLKSKTISEVMHVSRGTFQGTGALRARVTPLPDDPLPGGYAGTVIQLASPSVRVPAGTAIRIDAMIQTVGFSGPHQGVLVYDNLGGQEAGVLIRGRSDWTPVRLYRQTADDVTSDTEVQVMFELIGAGEATIDEVQVRLWEPGQQFQAPLPLQPIGSTPIAEENRFPPDGESTKR